MFKRFFLFLSIVSLFTGCAVQSSPNVYRETDTMRSGFAEMVTVVHIRPVTITSSGNMSAGSGVPAILSGVVGALLGGATIGNGSGRYVAAVLSGSVAAVVGQAAATHMSTSDGLEVIVRKEDGHQVVVAQAADQHFAVGERLYMVSGAGGYRLTR